MNPLRFDWEIIQIRAAEHDARLGGCRNQTHVSEHPGVEAHTFCSGRSIDGRLEHGSALIEQIAGQLDLIFSFVIISLKSNPWCTNFTVWLNSIIYLVTCLFGLSASVD